MVYSTLIACLITITGCAVSAQNFATYKLWYDIKEGIMPINDKTNISSFTYESSGSDWTGVCQTGKAQSPVSFRHSLSRFCTLDDHQPLYFVNYEFAKAHAVIGKYSPVIQADSPSPSITIGIVAGKLPDFYKFHSGHFHWPSEHIVKPRSKERHALELALIHVNQRYGTLEAAVRSGDGDSVAVVSIIYDKGPPDPQLDVMLAAVRNETNYKGFFNMHMKYFLTNNLTTLLPSNFDAYVRYDGSLTSPPCSEVVIWTVLTETRTVSALQLQEIVSLQFSSTKAVETFRAFQPLNNRRTFRAGAGITKSELEIFMYWLFMKYFDELIRI